MKNISDNVYGNALVSGDAHVYDNAKVFGDAHVSGNAWVYGNALVLGDAHVSGNAQVTGDAQIFGNAWLSGDALVSGDARVYGDALVSGDAEVSGNARVYGDARVSGNAQVFGDADIQSSNDWFSLIYQGKTLTGYRSRNDLGYEVNLDGIAVELKEVPTVLQGLILALIRDFTPFKKPKSDVDLRIENLERELAELKQLQGETR